MYTLIPFIVSLALSMIIYSYIDKRKKITSLAYAYLKVKNEFKALIFFVIFLLLGAILNIGYIPMNSVFLNIINGLLIGVGVNLTSQTNRKRNNNI